MDGLSRVYRIIVDCYWRVLELHGGMVVYRNSPAAARAYLEADRGRADDYYLTGETGLAERFSASPLTGVDHLGSLSGDGYEAWVAGVDPKTGIPKGSLRSSENAVRFVEVTVNGPKSWSLAAAIHPDISAAYDLAQDCAAEQIIGWLAQHATTRIGPRGAQVQVPVTEIEAVTVRHYTSRAGDPHRHLHLQVNARVQAEGRWYGLHTVGVRDSLDAINGIGHAAVLTDPDFRAALASHGFTLDPRTGEIVQMREYIGAFSTRTKQIEQNLDRYEAAWRQANPGQEPGPVLRQRWDHRAWNDARPSKIVPTSGEEITAAWLGELHALGYGTRPGRSWTWPCGPASWTGARRSPRCLPGLGGDGRRGTRPTCATIVESVTEVSKRGLVWGTPKGHERRDVPIPRFLVDDLAEHVAGRPADAFVFPAPMGGALRVRNFRRVALDPAANTIGVPDLHPHALRHTAASLAIASGADVKVVQQMLGHKSAIMTLDLYGHLFGDRLDVVADALDAARAAALAARVAHPLPTAEVIEWPRLAKRPKAHGHKPFQLWRRGESNP